MSGYTAADMTTARAKGYRDASEGAAQQMVAIHVNAVDSDGSLLYVHPPIAKRGDTLYLAAPVAAAPVDLDAHSLRALDNCITDLRSLLELADDFALDEMHIQSLLTAIESMELRKRTSTPAAPGIDRDQLGDLLEGMTVSIDVDGLFNTDGRRLFGTVTAVQHDDNEPRGLMLLVQDVQKLIDASPKVRRALARTEQPTSHGAGVSE